MASSREPPPAEPPRGRWALVGMLWFICFFNYADRQAIFSIFPLLESEFEFDKEQLGIIGMAFTWVYAFSAPFAGRVVDRFPRKIIILFGLYVWSVVTGFTALCSKVWHFVFVRGAEGLGETFYFPASMSLISDWHGRDTRSRAMSLHQTSVYAGTVGGGALAGWLAMDFGWQTPFVVLALAGIGLGLVLGVYIRERPRGAAEGREAPPPAARGSFATAFRDFRRTPTAAVLALAFCGANFVALVFLTWMPTFLKEKFGLSLAAAGVSATVFIQAASMAGSIAGGVLADRWRLRHAGGRILVQASGLLLGAPFIFICGQTLDMNVLVVAMTCFGFSKGLYDGNIWAALHDVIPPERRGTAVGLMNFVGWMGGGLGSFAVGSAVKRGATMSTAISSTAAIYLAVAGILVACALFLAPRDAAPRSSPEGSPAVD